MHVSQMSAYVGFEPFGGAYASSDLLNRLEEHETAMRARIEAKLANEDVAWSYERQTSDPVSALINSGALADLIVLWPLAAQPKRGLSAGIDDRRHARVRRTRRYWYVRRISKRFDPLGPAVVAWNGSFEAANALRAALPLLKQASAVHIVTVDEDKEFDFPPLGASEYLVAPRCSRRDDP